MWIDSSFDIMISMYCVAVITTEVSIANQLALSLSGSKAPVQVV